MIALSMQDAASAVEGRFSGEACAFRGVSTDSRTLCPGELFVALKGPRFDGHDSVSHAVQRGAAGAMIARELALEVPVIRVAETRKALGLLAQHWRSKHRIPVIGVTGSNGKTTTKELTAAILRQRGDVLATKGNLNNDIGVPLTLFQLADSHRAAIIEMGASGMRDIADLVTIARPSIGLVTMCGPAHLKDFGSIENVATAKGEIYRSLGVDGVAIINADDRFCDFWRSLVPAGRIVTFGLERPADYAALDIAPDSPGKGARFELRTPLGHIEVVLPLDGRHNIYNALAASAAAIAAGAELADVAKGLASAMPVAGRLNFKPGISGSVIIDDSYNANPASFAAALAVLAQCRQRRWVVFGDMGELGPDEIAQHRSAGELARESGVERLFAVGTLAHHVVDAFGDGAAHFADHAALLRALLPELRSGVAVLVKGSRFMQLDRIVTELLPAVSTSC